MRRLRRWLIAGLATALTAAAAPAAAQPPTEEELTVSPYALLHGSRDLAQRAERHERLAAIAETAGDFPRAARHYAIGCQARTSLTREAAPACARARALADQHKVIDATVQLQLVDAMRLAWSLNFQGAIKVLQAAGTTAATLDAKNPDHSPIMGVHQSLGSMFLEVGRFDEAQQQLTRARNQCRAAGNSVCAAYADLWLCRLNTVLGDFANARSACAAGAAEAAVDDDVLVRANLGWMVGTLEAFLGRHQAALTALQSSWQAAQTRGAEALQPIVAQLIVDALAGLGRLDEAETWQRGLEQGLKEGRIPLPFGPQIAMRRGQLALARGDLDAAQAAFAVGSRSFIHEMSIRGHLASASVSVKQGDLAGGRQSLDRAIARIEAGRTTVPGSALRASYLTLHSAAYRELAGLRWDDEGAAAAPAILEIAEAGRARALRDAVASAQAPGTAAPPLTAAAVQATLGPNDVLVEYVSTERRLLAITVTRDQIVVTPLPGAGTADDLRRRVDFFNALVQESDEAGLDRPAARLYDDLLAPALAVAPAAARTLIVAADGALHRLPFDAIGSPRVIERWDVVLVPSASALLPRPSPNRTSAALVVSASANAPGLPPLGAAPAEVAAIRRRVGAEIAELSGLDATREKLLAEDLDRFAVLHFASHAVVDEERPLRSALMLSGVNSRWTADDIFRQRLSADLVVLAACSTAAGTHVPGEGVMSLSRAFLYAGARATIATLWDVPDAPAPVFADVLYRELAAGQTLGAAVAGARRELRRQGAPPRAWAAYVLTGNPAATVGIAPRADRWRLSSRIAGGVAIGLLLVAAAAFFRPARTNIRWPAPVAGAVAAAVLAVGLGEWSSRDARLSPGDGVDRGTAALAFEPLVADNQVTWPASPGADEYAVELFDTSGLAVGAPATAAAPFALPAGTAAEWVRVEARHQGQLVARSAPVRVARNQ